MQAFLFDEPRCTGCQACMVACPGNWRRVFTLNERRMPGLPVRHFSSACNHCEDAACVRSCPAGVYWRDEATGAVLARIERCIGCRYCSWACPWDAPVFDANEGITSKCDFCVDRARVGRRPACVTTCPTGALEVGAESTGESAGPDWFKPAREIGARQEWPLVVFTTLAPVAVALMNWVGAALGAAALIIGAIHLGRKERVWRAVWNWRTSWLSREILLFGGFLGFGCASLRGPAAVAGFAALYAIDRLYQTAFRMPAWKLHSAGALLSGMYFLGLFGDVWPLAIAAGILKLVLYAAGNRQRQTWVGALRILLGFALPLAGLPWAAVAGEFIDRAEFYDDLKSS